MLVDGSLKFDTDILTFHHTLVWRCTPYCWWFRNPANQLRLIVYPIFRRVLAPSQVVRRISSINSSTWMSFRQVFTNWVGTWCKETFSNTIHGTGIFAYMTCTIKTYHTWFLWVRTTMQHMNDSHIWMIIPLKRVLGSSFTIQKVRLRISYNDFIKFQTQIP